jgi:hypothetical protein
MRHPHILRFYGIDKELFENKEDPQIGLVTRYLKNGTITTYLDRMKWFDNLPLDEAVSYIALDN